jgi:hypothetical protein
MSFAAINLFVASKRVFIVYFPIGSVRRLLDTPSYMEVSNQLHVPAALLSEDRFPGPNWIRD